MSAFPASRGLASREEHEQADGKEQNRQNKLPPSKTAPES